MAKVLLTDKNRPTETVTLPKSGANVTLYTELLSGDILNLPDEATSYQRGIYMLQRAIKSWEFVDENDQEIPVDIKSFDMLNVTDLKFMLRRVMKDVNDSQKDQLTVEKKSLSENTTSDKSDLNAGK